jgi:hypothetical protein
MPSPMTSSSDTDDTVKMSVCRARPTSRGLQGG